MRRAYLCKLLKSEDIFNLKLLFTWKLLILNTWELP